MRMDTITLRKPGDLDAAVHASFPPEPEIVRMYGGDPTRLPKSNLDQSMEWLNWLRSHPFARMIDLNGRAVGHVRLHSLVPEDRRARLAIGLFSGRFIGQGIGRRAIALTLDHAFGEMDLHRIDLRVLAFNTRAIRCYAACGFIQEGREREAALIGDDWHDDIIMGILSHEHAGLRSDNT